MVSMTDCVAVLSAIEMGDSVLPAAYIVCLILGGGLLLVSLLAGGGSEHGGSADLGDGGVDLAADGGLDAAQDFTGGGPLEGSGTMDTVGADTGGAIDSAGPVPSPAFSLAGWFSVQFVVYALAVFGLVGTTLTYVTDVPPGTALALAVGAGILLGQGVHQALRFLKRTSAGSEIRSAEFLHQPARVSVAIDPGRQGEIALALRGGERFVAAVGRRSDDRFRAGDGVVVVGFQAGVAVVTSRQEYDFVTGGTSEGQG